MKHEDNALREMPSPESKVMLTGKRRTIKAVDCGQDVSELGVAEVGHNLCLGLGHSAREAEGVHCPFEV